MQLVPLRRAFVVECLDEMLDLDREAVAAGDLEAWDGASWLADREDKWRLSWLVLDGSRIVGYRVMSSTGRLPRHAHGHRINILGERRRSGVGGRLMAVSHSRVRQAGFLGVTGLIEPGNSRSRVFFARHGYSPVQGRERLWAISFAKS